MRQTTNPEGTIAKLMQSIGPWQSQAAESLQTRKPPVVSNALPGGFSAAS